MKARTRNIFLGILIIALLILGELVSLLVTNAHQRLPISISPIQVNAGGTQSTSSSTSSNRSSTSGNATVPSATQTGPGQIQIALSQQALSSFLASQLGAQQNMLTDVQVIPVANNAVNLKFNLQIATNGIHRVLPIELDTTIELNGQQDVQMNVLHFKRDGLDTGAAASQQMQTALNQLLNTLLMPTIHNMLKGMKLVGVQTNVSLCCNNDEMLVLLLQLD
jgi:hypothetical protein